MSENLPNPLPAPRERGLYTPKPVQVRVLTRHLAGESNRKIAVEEGLDRETVNRILTQQELVELIAEQQTKLLRLGSKAIEVYEEALDCHDLGMAVATATKILEGTGVLDKRGLQATIDHAIIREEYRKTPCPEEFRQGPYGYRRPRKRTPRKPPTSQLPTGREGTADSKGGSPPLAEIDSHGAVGGDAGCDGELRSPMPTPENDFPSRFEKLLESLYDDDEAPTTHT